MVYIIRMSESTSINKSREYTQIRSHKVGFVKNVAIE